MRRGRQPGLESRRRRCRDRLEQIEALLPPQPVCPDTGARQAYHSRQYRLIAELIAMCRKLLDDNRET